MIGSVSSCPFPALSEAASCLASRSKRRTVSVKRWKERRPPALPLSVPGSLRRALRRSSAALGSSCAIAVTLA